MINEQEHAYDPVLKTGMVIAALANQIKTISAQLLEARKEIKALKAEITRLKTALYRSKD